MKDLITMRRYRLLLLVVSMYTMGLGVGFSWGSWTGKGAYIVAVGIILNAVAVFACPQPKVEKQ